MRFRASASSGVSVAATLAIALSAVSLAPALLAPGFPAGHDAAAHLTYVYLFDSALAQGQFPVRWVEWLQPGHSQPLFSFYQPGFYYAVQLVHLLIPSLLLSTKLTVLGAWWLGSGFVYLHLRPLGIWPAALGALLFMRAPYLIVDVFVRAALPEFLAIACAPAVLWSLHRVLKTASMGYAFAFATASAAMLLLHLPTVLMFLPVFVTYAACVWFSGGRTPWSLAAVMGAAALGLGLACFYVAPALLELHMTKIQALTSAYFDFRHHFVEPWQWVSLKWGYSGSEPGSADGLSFQVGIVQWLALGAGGATAIVALARRWMARAGWLFYWLCVAAAALFMTTAASATAWNAVAPLAFLQFPWRFLAVVSLAVGMVAALALSTVRSHTLQAALVLCVVGGLVWQTQGLLQPAYYLSREWESIDKPGWRYARHAARLAFIEPGYYPSTVVQLPDAHIERWAITRGAGVISAQEALDHRMVLNVSSAEGVELTIRSHGFPGWRVFIDGAPSTWMYDPQFGFIVIDVPPGGHTVEAVFDDTPVRAWSNWISVLSAAAWTACALVVLGAGQLRRRWRRSAS